MNLDVFGGQPDTSNVTHATWDWLEANVKGLKAYVFVSNENHMPLFNTWYLLR